MAEVDERLGRFLVGLVAWSAIGAVLGAVFGAINAVVLRPPEEMLLLVRDVPLWALAGGLLGLPVGAWKAGRDLDLLWRVGWTCAVAFVPVLVAVWVLGFL